MVNRLTASTNLTPVDADDEVVIPHIFHDVLKRDSNSPEGEGWALVADCLDEFASIITGNFLPNLTATVRSAEKGAATLFKAVIVAKTEHVELGFQSLLDGVSGRSFGARLINWAMSKMDVDLSDDLKVAWGSFHQQMASTIEMLIRQLEPRLIPGAPLPDVTQIVEHIRRNGGIGKLHMDYMNRRRVEKQEEREKVKADRERGAAARHQEDAQKAGFATWDDFQKDLTAKKERKRIVDTRSKFDVLKRGLIERGTLVTNAVQPTEGCLLIAHGGNLYIIAEPDEFSLLSCAAAVL